jgi:NADH-quinone oxidoreductase subunit J
MYMTITTELIIFLVLAVIAITSAIAMLMSDNAIYSALFLVLTMAVLSVFFLILNAPFIAMVQVTVYAGAIMVLFMFVIMLLGAEKLRQGKGRLGWQGPLAFGLAIALVVVGLGGAFLRGVDFTAPPIFPAEMVEAFGSPLELGKQLFTTYLFPFEVTSILLLVAMIGAIVLTKEDRPKVQKRVKTVK